MSHQFVALKALLEDAECSGDVLISSSRLRRLYERIERIAPFEVTVLIEGESGSGKELIANAIHRLGSNPDGPFVTLNCATLVGQLAESQLFGHLKGAFTDARDNSLGYFRGAEGGTLFLDEIGEMPLELQPKILRAVENREIQPVGSYKSFQTNVRLVAATNRNLRAMVSAGTFRADLFHRLNAVSLTTPPLRECREAIGPLAAHFVIKYSREIGKAVTRISRSAVHALLAHDWPGNIRELSNAIRTAVLLTDIDCIDTAHLPPAIAGNEEMNQIEIQATSPDPPETTSLEEPPAAGYDSELDSITRSALVASLERTGGNRQQAAKILGVSRQKLYRMIARYDLTSMGRDQ